MDIIVETLSRKTFGKLLIEYRIIFKTNKNERVT
jgi:hypothetical protein